MAGPSRTMRAVLRALTLCAGGLVTDRMLMAVAGCAWSTLRTAVFYLIRRGYHIERVIGLGYRLVLPA